MSSLPLDNHLSRGLQPPCLPILQRNPNLSMDQVSKQFKSVEQEQTPPDIGPSTVAPPPRAERDI